MSISFSRVLSSLFRRMSLFSAALSFTGLVFLAQPASAQQSQRAREADHPAPAQTAAAIKSLSTQSQVVIARLAKLGEVRIGNWKYHFGELPNGQSPALDDSSWPEIHGRVNPSGDNWLRKWVEIPASVAGYDLTGCRVMVSLMVHAYGGEGATIFIDGKPIAQINHSEPVVAYYKPGDRVLLTVKYGRTPTASNLPSAYTQIQFSSGRPNPWDLYTEFITATLLTPDLSQNVAADLATLNKAIEDVDVMLSTPMIRIALTLRCARHNRIWTRCGRPCSRPPITSTATRTSTRPGCGRGPKGFSLWSARSARRWS